MQTQYMDNTLTKEERLYQRYQKKTQVKQSPHDARKTKFFEAKHKNNRNMYSPFKTGVGAIEDTIMDESCEVP